MGNPGPVFGARAVRLEGARRVGNGHLKATLASAGGRLGGIGFGWADRGGWLERAARREPVDVAFRLETNEYQGEISLQARIVALTTPPLAALPADQADSAAPVASGLAPASAAPQTTSTAP